MKYLYIFGTILFTVYGQLVIKWRVSLFGDLPKNLLAIITFLLKVMLDPFVISGFCSAFVASFFWLAAMTKFEISFAYPFMSLSFILVLVLSGVFLDESVTIQKCLGLVIIILGIIVSTR
jgi:multidrug transporter EmrE-like cation transporter